jgi:hypothetical protein
MHANLKLARTGRLHPWLCSLDDLVNLVLPEETINAEDQRLKL